MSIQSKGAKLATAAAFMALSMSAMAAANPAGSTGAAIGAGDKVHCYGVTTCKGSTDCKTAENACQGQNACGGHGFKGITAKECLAKGGTIADIKAK